MARNKREAEKKPARPAQPPGDIELLVVDVDGVLTDGRIVLDDEGKELKCFHVLDGAGIKYFQRVGRKVAFISGRRSAAVKVRADELGVNIVAQGAKDKLPLYIEILAALGVDERRAAVMGDDLTDLPMMRHCGFAIAPAGAVEMVREAADMVTQARGGQGAVREAIEALLLSAGLWERILARYTEKT